MATEKQGENVNNWKEKLHEIYEERRIAIIKKKANKKAALAWVREKLYPAFNKLVKELKEIGDIEFASHTATGKSLDNTLDFTFREFEFGETSLRYSIKLLISSKGIMGKYPLRRIIRILSQKKMFHPSSTGGNKKSSKTFCLYLKLGK